MDCVFLSEEPKFSRKEIIIALIQTLNEFAVVHNVGYSVTQKEILLYFWEVIGDE